MLRILAVDDDLRVLGTIRAMVTHAGHQVETVDSGSRFMAAYSRIKPDVVILDVVMPGVDGIELIQWLIDIDSKVSVVICSGSPVGNLGEMAARFARAAGLANVSLLPKPFRLAALTAAISGAAPTADRGCSSVWDGGEPRTA